MKNRKSIMALSGILIIIFHLWINLSSGFGIEAFIKQTAYVGVDMFFFLSAYSLGGREVENYGKFVFSRFKAVYIKYIMFAVIAWLYLGWKVSRFFKVIGLVELFTKGGGAFLWFLPAIMILYILFPLFQRCDKKNRPVTIIVVLLTWLLLSFVISRFTTYKAIYIFTNRIPVFLLGYYLSATGLLSKMWHKSILRLCAGVIATALGLFLAYKFAFTTKLMWPFVDSFYITLIPLAFGLILLAGFIPEFAVIKWIGSSTLEMYALQMIFGYKISNKLYSLTQNALLVNITTILSVILISVLLHYLYEFIIKKASA